MRSTVAAMTPTRITRGRRSGGKPAAARPMTTALSPASTRSIMMTCNRAITASCENVSHSLNAHAPVAAAPDGRINVLPAGAAFDTCANRPYIARAR